MPDCRSLCALSIAVLLSSCGRPADFPPDTGKYDLGDKVLTAAAPEGAAGQVPEAPPKRIIHNATVGLRVADYSAAEKGLLRAVKEAGGYVAEYREAQVQDRRTAGTLVARVPAERFESFLEGLAGVGVVERKEIDSREVTEEFVDLQSRLASKKRVEQRVAEILAQKAGEVREVIAIETELGRVREEVERIEGRLRYLADRTEMTTVTIALREERYYVPEPTTLAERVSAAFGKSVSALQTAAEAALLLVVVVFPWAAVALVAALPCSVVLRLRKRRLSARPL